MVTILVTDGRGKRKGLIGTPEPYRGRMTALQAAFQEVMGCVVKDDVGVRSPIPE